MDLDVEEDTKGMEMDLASGTQNVKRNVTSRREIQS